jgi:hypothetical protein
VFLEMDYDLEAGRIHVVAPQVEYLIPGTAWPLDTWDYLCAKPGANKKLATTLLPLAGEIEVRITFAPGTRAGIKPPTLRKILSERVEPWPIFPAGAAGGGLDEQERERLKALGYL